MVVLLPDSESLSVGSHDRQKRVDHAGCLPFSVQCRLHPPVASTLPSTNGAYGS